MEVDGLPTAIDGAEQIQPAAGKFGTFSRLFALIIYGLVQTDWPLYPPSIATENIGGRVRFEGTGGHSMLILMLSGQPRPPARLRKPSSFA